MALHLYVWSSGDQMAVAYAESVEQALDNLRNPDGSLPPVVADTPVREFDSPVTFDPSVFDAGSAVDNAYQTMHDTLVELRQRISTIDTHADSETAQRFKSDALRLIDTALPSRGNMAA